MDCTFQVSHRNVDAVEYTQQEHLQRWFGSANFVLARLSCFSQGAYRHTLEICVRDVPQNFQD